MTKKLKITIETEISPELEKFLATHKISQDELSNRLVVESNVEATKTGLSVYFWEPTQIETDTSARIDWEELQVDLCDQDFNSSVEVAE